VYIEFDIPFYVTLVH